MAIAPRFSKLLDGCGDMASSHLHPLIDRMFENADVALLSFAEKAESNAAQAVFFEAMAEVRKKRSAIESHFFREINRSFSEFPVKPEEPAQVEETPDPFGGLSLVDREEMETSVAMLNASSKLGTRIMDKIFGLKQRLAVINHGNAIEESQIPAGPAWLGTAYRHAVEHLDLENRVRLVFIALFEKYVLNRVDALYDEFNERLIQAGIFPNLRYEVRKQPGGIEIVKTTADNAEPQTVVSEEPLDDQTPSELGDELFGRICDLIAVRRGSPRPAQGGGGSAYGGADPGGSAAPSGAQPMAAGERAGDGGTGAPISGPSSALVGEISRLQSAAHSGPAPLSSAELVENIEIDENLIERLQNTLSAEREKIFGGVDRRKVPSADTNVIELVGMLFEYMLQEEGLPNVVKALLSRLHTPLLKVAILDRHFFTRARHPARKLLNDMTAAGKRWVEESNIERGIFPKMREVVDRILLEFEDDVGVFELFVEEFGKAVAELKQRAQLVEQRNAEAADGQDKLQAARSRAQQQISTLLAGKPAAEEAREFLQRLWADKLTFILLRNPQGEDSEDWQQAVSLARRLTESLLPPASEQARQTRTQELAGLQQELREQTKTMQHADKGKLLVRLFETQLQALKKVVAESQSAAAPEPAPQAAEPAPREDSQSAPLTAAQRDAMEKLKSTPFGTWFEFSRDDSAAPQRAKLSWRSTMTEKFMFVDRMGVKTRVIALRELADCMISGSVRIVEQEKKPFVDRALNAIHRMLDHGTKQKAQA